MDNRTPEERFWSKVDRRGDDECWGWRAGITSTGYAGFHFDGRSSVGHRFSYILHHGPIDPSLVIDHNCHNIDPDCPGGVCPHRACVNPAHLRAVPQGENLWSSQHTVNHASMAATHCPKGHPYSGDNLAHDGTHRYCRTCSRARNRAIAPRRSAELRERYALLRAAGLSSAEARSASKVRVAMHCGPSLDSEELAGL